MSKKIYFRLLGIITSGCILYLLLFGIVYFGMAREDFFLSAIDIPKLEERWGVQETDIQRAVNEMLSYVKSWDDGRDPQFQLEMHGEMTDFYSEREMSHLRDVQKVMTGFAYAAIAALGIGVVGFCILFRKKCLYDMAYGYICVLGLTLLILVVIGIISLIDIQWLINTFHKLLFDNKTWVLNPAKDKIVWFFTKAVYRKMIVYLTAVAGVVIVMLIGSVCYIKKYYVNFFKKR